MPKNYNHIVLKLDDDFHEELKAVAKKARIPMSVYARILIAEHLRAEKEGGLKGICKNCPYYNYAKDKK